jgi:sirohydrochlorin cobaltochelatase
MQSAVILFGHGSRDPAWSQCMLAVRDRILALAPGIAVECAYLELMQPTLDDAVAAHVRGGASHIRVLPMFFGVGRHVREDLPLMVDTLRRTYPAISLAVDSAIGENAEVVQLLAELAIRKI